VTIDADRDAATCRDFGVTAFPTVVVIDAEGQERYRATGAEAAVDLAATLEHVLGGAAGGRVAIESGSTRNY
jgi:predicted DsbA family dithiol-disulfide isomerase